MCLHVCGAATNAEHASNMNAWVIEGDTDGGDGDDGNTCMMTVPVNVNSKNCWILGA